MLAKEATRQSIYQKLTSSSEGSQEGGEAEGDGSSHGSRGGEGNNDTGDLHVDGLVWCVCIEVVGLELKKV